MGLADTKENGRERMEEVAEVCVGYRMRMASSSPCRGTGLTGKTRSPDRGNIPTEGLGNEEPEVEILVLEAPGS